MIRKTLLAAALAGFALQAQAAIVVYGISSSPFDTGSLAGQTLSGQFSFDDAALTAATTSLPLSSFSFTLAGQSYTLTGLGLDQGTVVFSGGQVTGVDATFNSGAIYDVLFADAFGSPYALYSGATRGDFGQADLSFTAAVPEPDSYALILTGLGIVGFLARRRKTS